MDLNTLISTAIGKDAAACLPTRAAHQNVADLCDDSRLVTPGAVFVAVAGNKKHGTVFVDDAVKRGATTVIADTDVSVDAGTTLIRVPDARKAVAKLAAVYFGLRRAQVEGGFTVIGITGTNGKSTIAHMIRSMLQAAGKKVGVLGTIEYDLVERCIPADLTTPGPIALTRHLVEAYQAGAEYAAIEVSSHSLDQSRTDGIDFDVAVFTNLTQDHLDYHATPEAYLLAKRRLFEGLASDKTAVVNANEPISERMLDGCSAKVIRFGTVESADLRGRVLAEDATGSRFLVEYAGQQGKYADREIEMRTAMVGRHNVLNALAAAAAVAAVGVDPAFIKQGLADAPVVRGRLERVGSDDLGFDVFVDYAHTDDALRNVLRAIKPLTRGRLSCVFGCGGDRDKTKRPLMAKAVAEQADAFFITSDNPRTEDPLKIIADIHAGLSPSDLNRATTEPDRAKAIQIAVAQLKENDALIIAGKGHEDYQILGTEKVHFDDVEVAREAISQMGENQTCER